MVIWCSNDFLSKFLKVTKKNHNQNTLLILEEIMWLQLPQDSKNRITLLDKNSNKVFK